MNGFQMRIVSEEHWVLSSTVDEIPDEYIEDMKKQGIHHIEDCTVFYFKERDAIVLNERHPYFEALKGLVIAYMDLDDNNRREVLEQAPSEGVWRFLILIEMAIGYRRKQGEQRRSKPQLKALEEIKIYPEFEMTTPNEEKYEERERYYMEHDAFKSKIVLDASGHLIDGYISYLIAVNYGVDVVPVEYKRREVVKAYHNVGGKLYDWELPSKLVGHTKPGDKLIVPAHGRRAVVTVASVEEYTGQSNLKRAYRRKQVL